MSFNFPSGDVYWVSMADFIRDSIGTDRPFIAPREFYPILPRVFPYEFVHSLEIVSEQSGIALHKGLLDELPLSVVEFVRDEWKCIFANEVFVFLVPESTLPSVDKGHLQSLNDGIRRLQKATLLKRSQIDGTTGLVVVASHAPAALESTLRDLALLSAPILVMSPSRDGDLQEKRAAVCRKYRAQFEPLTSGPSVEEALEQGIRQMISEKGASWIATFDDSMQVRADLLLVMEKLRDLSNNGLGGLWSEDAGVRATFSHDGLACIVPQRETSLHRYAHADHWRRILAEKGAGSSVRRIWGRLFSSRPAAPFTVVPGLVTRQDEGERISTL